jgi:type III pantothenate kinase
LIIGENTELGIKVRTSKPSEVGSDRLVNALGALKLYCGPLIIVDSGTAITLDVIGSDGGFDGGVIAPGVHLSMEALHAVAAKLPRIALLGYFDDETCRLEPLPYPFGPKCYLCLRYDP